MENNKDFPIDINSMMDSLLKELSLDNTTIELSGALKELVSISNILSDDITSISEVDYSKLSSKQKRDAVRSIFAIIEGLTYCLKQAALEFNTQLDKKLSIYEQMAINEEIARIDDSGNIKISTEFSSITSNVRFAFNVFEKVTNSEFKLKVDTADWAAFKKSIPVRHRITHPKRTSDLEITEFEISSLIKVCLWFYQSICGALFLSIRALLIRKYAKPISN